MLNIVIKIWCLVNILFYLFLGSFTCFFHDKLLSHLKLIPSANSAIAEIKATYGGFLFAFGLFMLLLLLRKEFELLLLLLTFSYIGYMFGRFLGLIMNKATDTQTYLYFGIELLSVIVSFTLYIIYRQNIR